MIGKTNVVFLSGRACPCCGAAEGELLVASAPPGECCDWAVLKESWRGFFKKKTILSYRRCQNCRLLYAPLYFTDDALVELYGNMPDNTAGLPRELLRATQNGYYQFLRRYDSLAGDYFELGPDTGLFTGFVAADKREGKFWLYEPNKAVWPDLKTSVAGRSHEVRPEMHDFSAVPDGSLGTIVMIHVLDHLPDARQVLAQLCRKMRSGGRLLVVTHDERSLLARLLGVRWPAYCLQHPHLFNRRTTAEFLRQCGFRVLETRKSVNHFPATYLLKHLLFALGATKLSALLEGRSVVLPLRLGNIMTVAEPDHTVRPGSPA